MDQILTKETQGQNTAVLTDRMEASKRVGQYNSDRKIITVDMKNITDNRIQRERISLRTKEFVVRRNWFVWVMYVLKY